MSKPLYIKTKPYTFQHRLAMCQEVHEGTEFGECLSLLCEAANSLNGINYTFEAEISLLMAEKLCQEYIDYTRDSGNWEEYNQIDQEAYKHFTEGEEKMDKQGYNIHIMLISS